MRSIAQFVSFAFHPLLLITLGVYFILELDFIYHYALNTQTLWLYLSIVILGTFIIPINAIFLTQKLINKDINLYMEKKEDRRFPLLIAAVCVMLTLYLFSYRVGFRAPHLIRGYLIGCSLSIISAAILNNRFKISLHAIGVGGITGLLFYLQSNAFMDLRPVIAIWIMLSGLVCWSRLHLHAHYPAQIYAGYLTGLTFVFLTVRI